MRKHINGFNKFDGINNHQDTMLPVMGEFSPAASSCLKPEYTEQVQLFGWYRSSNEWVRFKEKRYTASLLSRLLGVFRVSTPCISISSV